MRNKFRWKMKNDYEQRIQIREMGGECQVYVYVIVIYSFSKYQEFKDAFRRICIPVWDSEAVAGLSRRGQRVNEVTSQRGYLSSKLSTSHVLDATSTYIVSMRRDLGDGRLVRRCSFSHH